MDIPSSLKQSRLWIRLQEDSELLNALLALRAVTKTLADTISRSGPAFTDHSIRHMDALWNITDHILTQDEVALLSLGEAFLLACGFYLHDIGMAYAATDEGITICRASTPYASFISKIPDEYRDDPLVKARLSRMQSADFTAMLQSNWQQVPFLGLGLSLRIGGNSRSVGANMWADRCKSSLGVRDDRRAVWN